MKINHLGSRNPRLHSNEILIALAITAMSNEDANLAMQELGKLKGSEAHSTVMLTDEDKNVLRKLGINVTMDPRLPATIACHRKINSDKQRQSLF
ncbi:MAG: hypothetical protein ACLRZG_02380 [Streptococcus sp.]